MVLHDVVTVGWGGETVKGWDVGTGWDVVGVIEGTRRRYTIPMERFHRRFKEELNSIHSNTLYLSIDEYPKMGDLVFKGHPLLKISKTEMGQGS